MLEIKLFAKSEQARSYISTEPGIRRANQSNYDAVYNF